MKNEINKILESNWHYLIMGMIIGMIVPYPPEHYMWWLITLIIAIVYILIIRLIIYFLNRYK